METCSQIVADDWRPSHFQFFSGRRIRITRTPIPLDRCPPDASGHLGSNGYAARTRVLVAFRMHLLAAGTGRDEGDEADVARGADAHGSGEVAFAQSGPPERRGPAEGGVGDLQGRALFASAGHRMNTAANVDDLL